MRWLVRLSVHYLPLIAPVQSLSVQTPTSMSDQPAADGSTSPTLSEKQRGKLPASNGGMNVDITERDILLDESRLDQVRRVGARWVGAVRPRARLGAGAYHGLS